jgi:hypothetical protein
MNVDPVASMRCWAVDIELGDRTFTVPPLPAADWWPVLADADPSAVLQLIESDPTDPGSIDEALLAGMVNEADLGQAITDAVEEATGRSLHAGLVLAAVAQARWAEIGGQLAQRGFRWDVQPIGAALDAIYFIVVSGLPEKDGDKKPRQAFLDLLANEAITMGSKGVDKRREQAVSDFESLAGPRPTAAPAQSTGGRYAGERPKTRTRPRPPRQAGQ